MDTSQPLAYHLDLILAEIEFFEPTILLQALCQSFCSCERSTWRLQTSMQHHRKTTLSKWMQGTTSKHPTKNAMTQKSYQTKHLQLVDATERNICSVLLVMVATQQQLLHRLGSIKARKITQVQMGHGKDG